MELLKCNDLEPTKLQLNGLSKDASLEKFMPQGDLPGGSWSTKMTKEGDHLKNHDKMTQSGMMGEKSTKGVEMTNVMKSIRSKRKS